MVKRIFLITGYDTSDIGKGWLTSAIGSSLTNVLPVKIDPMLNCSLKEVRFMHTSQPTSIAFNIGDGKYVSSDPDTYSSVGLSVKPEYNFVGGNILINFLEEISELKPSKKLTFADVSKWLSERISELADSSNKDNICIELGGTILSPENIYVPGMLRFLGMKYNLEPQIVLLTHFLVIKDKRPYGLKTNLIRDGIEAVRSHFGKDPVKTFVRSSPSGEIPNIMKDIQLKELKTAAYEVQVSEDSLCLVPECSSLAEYTKFIKETIKF